MHNTYHTYDTQFKNCELKETNIKKYKNSLAILSGKCIRSFGCLQVVGCPLFDI